MSVRSQSVPGAVKWVSPFRELLIRGFQTLPLTLIGTIGFFAANSTNPVFIFLTFCTALVIPISVYFTQWGATIIKSKFPQSMISFFWQILFGSVFLFCITFPFIYGFFENITGLLTLEAFSLLFLFLFNFSLGDYSFPIQKPENSACNLVNILPVDKTVNQNIAPSYWLTSIMFLTMYIFRNALDNYNVIPDPANNPEKVTRRKIQTTFAMLAIAIIGIIVIVLRIYTGCENGISIASSFTLAAFLSSLLYTMASQSGIDFFGMFQNINFGCADTNYTCVLTTS
jgi:hypothetical protein